MRNVWQELVGEPGKRSNRGSRGSPRIAATFVGLISSAKVTAQVGRLRHVLTHSAHGRGRAPRLRHIVAAALAVMAGASAQAADIERSSADVMAWSNPSAWVGGVLPGATDRVVFTAASGSELWFPATTTVGALFWTGNPLAQSFSYESFPTQSLLFIAGINGVGMDLQNNYVARLYNAIGITADQTWRVSNAAGGSFVQLGSGGYMDLGAHTLTLDLVNAVNYAQLGYFVGTGNLVKTGLGALTLFGTSTYTGTTTVDGGMLALRAGASIEKSSLLSVNGTGTFDMTATNAAIKSLAGNGSVVLGPSALTLTQAGSVFSGVISGAGSVTVSGGWQVLAGDNTYTGGTTVGPGATLQLGNRGSAGSVAGDITDDGTLVFNRADTATMGGLISGNGALVQQGAGTLILNASNTYAGTTTVQSGTLVVGDASHPAATLGAGDVSVAAGATLGGYGAVPGAVNNSGTILVASALSSPATATAGSLTINGDLLNRGEVTLGAADGQTGDTLNVLGNMQNQGLITLRAVYGLTGNAFNVGGNLQNQGVLTLGAAYGQKGNAVNVFGNLQNQGLLTLGDVNGARGNVLAVFGNLQNRGLLTVGVANGASGNVLRVVSNLQNQGVLTLGDAYGRSGNLLTVGGDLQNQGVLTLGAAYGASGNVVNVLGNLQNHGMFALGAAYGPSGNVVNVRGNLQNQGALVLGAANAQTSNVAHVFGNYTGNNATLVLNAVPGAGGTVGHTDLLTIAGDASGNTTIRVAGSVGGTRTTGDGIPLVQVGGTSNATAFQLSGAVQAGAYEYLLYRGGSTTANSWYLRSQLTSDPNGPIAYRPAVAGYAMSPLLNMDYGFSVLGQRNERIGDKVNIDDTPSGRGGAVWGRVGGRQLDMAGNERFASDARAYFAQFGRDWIVSRTDTGGRTHAGVTFTVGTQSANIADNARASNLLLSASTGTLSTQAQSVGGYWTRYGADGAYVDAVVQLTHYYNKYTDTYSASAAQNGFGAAGSLEIGKPWALGSTAIAIEPQAQLAYQYLHLNDFNDGISPVSANTNNALRGRLGLRLFRADLQNETGIGSATPYLTASLVRDFLSPGATTLSSASLTMSPARTWYELGAGASAGLGKASKLYAHLGYGKNLGGTYRRTLFAQVGLRYRW